MAQYRYSAPKFRASLIIAGAITAMVTGLVWMLLTALGFREAVFWSAMTAFVFFGFISAQMLRRYLRREPVLAIWPTGLYVAGQGDTLPWEQIRAITLMRREDEYALNVSLWPDRQTHAGRSSDFYVELAPLESDPGTIIEEIRRYRPVEIEAGLGAPF